MFKLLKKTPFILKKNKIIKLQNIIQKRNYVDDSNISKEMELFSEKKFKKFNIILSGLTFCVTELSYLVVIFSSHPSFSDFVISLLISIGIAMFALPILCLIIVSIPICVVYELLKKN